MTSAEQQRAEAARMSQVADRLQAKLQQQQEDLEAAAEAVQGAQQQAKRADELSIERKVSCAFWGSCTRHCQLEDLWESWVAQHSIGR